jgi:hypothetical protein
MTPNTTLTLGDFTFARYEIPERIPFGGDQQLNVHKLVGGVRVIDALGADPMPIEWSGFFAFIHFSLISYQLSFFDQVIQAHTLNNTKPVFTILQTLN